MYIKSHVLNSKMISLCFSKTGDIAALHRGTPLYGQPSWWGDGDADDENSFKQENKTSGKKQENSGTGKILFNIMCPQKYVVFFLHKLLDYIVTWRFILSRSEPNRGQL